ncbi:MAG: hypothetical protein UR79_C0002G0158 [Candidatus Campbellbacteria bacterium GW2011_GWD1_35_49]|nr:MAG: hypothetical protein UR74_C0002G0175 [Candidatus Campbellbacteria bacterium GW2011_GWD2_35_24]KKP75795.1 MAG: hypothetical protein UR75_C0002G0176 [Candidatus Campbellbacteria bacterium GW2011_GWC2_35_28]KKP76957.1 MAG: hypothetical protein UR76_C0002G0158 [Candidatus Campbellbacteria bacterium GW2011_GWC1_35_31]KKP78883.1 MAG: hypothetical protein UR79_C0002G0158 [Candidatus Campbellbacteria bacterium GW2011_GWD1_35_49]
MRFRKEMLEKHPWLKGSATLSEAEIAHTKKIARTIFGIAYKEQRPNPIDDPGKCLKGSLS